MIESPALWTPRARSARRIIEATRSRADPLASTRSRAPQPSGINYTWPAPGMILAWRADLGVTQSAGSVTQWTDQVAGFKLVPGTGGAQPSVAPTFVASAIGGRPGVDFSGNANTGFSVPVGASPTLPAINFPLAYYVVCKTVAGSTSADVLLSYQDATFGTRCSLEWGAGGGGASTLTFLFGFTNETQNVASTPVGTPCVVGGMVNATGLNGALYFNSPTAILSTYTNPFGEGKQAANTLYTVGNRSGGGQRAFVQVCEIVGVNAATFDRTSYMTVWVAQAYGIAITP